MSAPPLAVFPSASASSSAGPWRLATSVRQRRFSDGAGDGRIVEFRVTKVARLSSPFCSPEASTA
jgi:hypothetical protein